MSRFSTKELLKKYEKYTNPNTYSGYKSNSKSYGNSSFWLGNDFGQTKSRFNTDKASIDYVTLAGYKRAIGNFVRIVTGRDDIKVMYSSGNQSYTDGKNVVISASLDNKEFDATVGLALHEGSHVALTSFAKVSELLNYNGPDIANAYLKVFGIKPGTPGQEVMLHIFINNLKDLMNIIEDRRIDRYVYDSAPGYQGYYQALYDKYFNAKEIDQALQNNIWNEVKFEHYINHICNFINPNRNLKALPKLQEIWNVIDIPRISRLTDKNSAQSAVNVFNVAVDVYVLIQKAIEEAKAQEAKAPKQDKKQDSPKDKSKSDSKSNDQDLSTSEEENDEEGGMSDPNMDMPMQGDSSSSSSSKGDESDSEEEGGGQGAGNDESDQESSEEEKGDGEGSGGKEESDGSDDEEDTQPKKELSAREANALGKKIQAQKDFLNGKIKKKGMSKEDAAKINAAAESNMSYVEVGGGVNGVRGSGTTKCMVVKGITDSIINSGMISSHMQDPANTKANAKKGTNTWGSKIPDPIGDGIRLGTMLGKKLKTRDEDRSLKTTRMETGAIDKRLIAELGFGNDRVFARTEHYTVTPSLVHISLDASGSMSGDRWNAAIKTSVAIAKAASMVSSMDCIISIRGTFNQGTQSPLMWIVYDSRKDAFSPAMDKMYGLRASGSTPEGLCFEAISKETIAMANGKDMYFINVSDGEPGYSDNKISYGGDYALTHTQAQVNKMRAAGIKVLSYFVSYYDISSSSYYNTSSASFKKMYGADASCIDVNNLNQLAKSLNNLFVRK